MAPISMALTCRVEAPSTASGADIRKSTEKPGLAEVEERWFFDALRSTLPNQTVIRRAILTR